MYALLLIRLSTFYIIKKNYEKSNAFKKLNLNLKFQKFPYINKFHENP